MIIEEFLKQIKMESLDIEDLTTRNYYTYLDRLFKMIAYDGDRLNRKHNLLITPYLQYISNTRRDDFRDDLSKTELQEVIDSLKTDLDCMIFRIETILAG
ncbi:hypothetical protein [Mucilaginibacter sp. FT3.2]|uniref:hypothetical protein n=1 Tax=Mucilaginibacter sp. FT3.2 TaxID=2723090 RepID=UPI00160A376D|nr:hypothetical protein [Mucilaginibacter sp. FT3.2]MBB6233261.1 hypothetical protein [Mucilaginibacter sp. FT3.2]